MLGKIMIKGLTIFAFHGVNPEEKENGQKFILDIIMYTDMEKAVLTDQLEDTVNYAAVRKIATAVMTENGYNLIEYAANKVAERILDAEPSIKKIQITLKKPEAPMNAVFDYVAVEITKERA